MSLLTNLVAWWELGETSGTRSDSHGSFHLTDNNTVGSAAGKVGNAASFARASSESLSHADHADLSVGDADCTFAGWVYLDSKPGADVAICSKDRPGAQGDGEWYLSHSHSPDRFAFTVFGASGFGSGTGVNANTLGSPSTGTWYFVVAWHDSVNNLIGISVNDGTPDTAAHSAGIYDGSSSVFRLGADGYATDYFDGRIDQFGFWKRVLSSGERTALYNGGAGLSYAGLSGGGGTTADGAGAAAGVATASGAGASRAASAGSASGVASASGSSAALFASPGSSSGVAAASGVGSSLVASAGSSAGTATASGSASSLAAAGGSAAGAATASGTGSALIAGAGSASGVAAASGSGSALAATVGSASGTATATGSAPSTLPPGITDDEGAPLASFANFPVTNNSEVGSTASGAGSSSGVAAASGIGSSRAAGAGSASGSSTASGVGASSSLGQGVGAASGASAVAGIGSALIASAGSASGVSTASGAGSFSLGPTGSSSGTATATGVGASLAAAVGLSAGVATAAGIGSTASPEADPVASWSRTAVGAPHGWALASWD